MQTEFPKILRIALLILASASPCVTPAEPRVFQSKSGKFSIDVPREWTDSDGLFGMQVMLLGPKREPSSRPVIALTDPQIEGVQVDSLSLRNSEAEYKSGRLQWLNKHQGKALRFFPYRQDKTPDGSDWHSIGYEYEMGGVAFVERSSFVSCGGKLYHLKSMIRSDQQEEFGAVVEKTIRSFSCK